jgi:glutaconyl-CoA/methylmalonyl-CoA decarboxylase subunit gamma
MKYHLEINKKNFDVTISGIAGNMAHVLVNGQTYEVSIGKPPKLGAQPAADHLSVVAQTAATPVPVPAQKPKTSLPSGMPGQEPILAPIPGLILEIKVKAGEAVSAGQTVAVLEAMKMENSLTTHVSGTVMEIRVEKGSEVSTGDVILIIDNQQF